MLAKIKATLKHHQMITSQKPIVVGVSGGPDSIVLVEALSQLVPNTLIVAHLNHMFRGIEAKEDAEFVREFCNKKGIEVVIEEYDVKAYMAEEGLGTQEAAREVRYRFYEEVVNKWNAGYVALGHHVDDQAETVLMRLIRGTGIQGLGGIPYTREMEQYKIIRPLLDVTKEEIISYAKKHSITYRIDQSNLSTKYYRNKIRLEIIPFLETYNYNFTEHLHALAKVAQAENDYLLKETEKLLKKVTLEKNSVGYKLNNEELESLDIALQRRLIHLILSYLGLKQKVTFVHIEQILHLIQQPHPSKILHLSGVIVYRNYQELIFSTKIPNEKLPYKYQLSVDEEIELPFIHKKIRMLVTNNQENFEGTWAVFDYQSLLECDLTVRSRKAGDKIKGITGSKKIKDIFIDYKIPKEDRDLYPLICCNEQVIWIPGIKRSNYALVSENTTSYLYIFFEDM